MSLIKPTMLLSVGSYLFGFGLGSSNVICQILGIICWITAIMIVQMK